MQLNQTVSSSPNPSLGAVPEPDRKQRERLMREAFPVVVSLASDLLGSHRRWSISHEDLVSAGLLGLVQASRAFDHRPGVRFSSFAYHRIRGAMLDEVRRLAGYERHIVRRVGRFESGPPCEATSDGGVGPVGGDSPDTSTPSPEDVVDRRLVAESFRKALAVLSERERAIVERLYIDHDGSFDSLAREMGTHRASIWHVHARAIARLRAEMS